MGLRIWDLSRGILLNVRFPQKVAAFHRVRALHLGRVVAMIVKLQAGITWVRGRMQQEPVCKLQSVTDCVKV